LWSYAIYLTHKSVCILVAARLGQAGHGAGEAVTIAASLLASLLAGWLLYALVETPFMRVRERWFALRAAAGPAERGPAERGPAERGPAELTVLSRAPGPARR
jgi:peptidoglycan/LPS O-acetylase OafA/YrhL